MGLQFFGVPFNVGLGCVRGLSDHDTIVNFFLIKKQKFWYHWEDQLIPDQLLSKNLGSIMTCQSLLN